MSPSSSFEMEIILAHDILSQEDYFNKRKLIKKISVCFNLIFLLKKKEKCREKILKFYSY